MESLIGQIIDNYKILSILGKGGMGTVYKAVDTYLDKIVALKMIDPVLALNKDFSSRFKKEARALAKLVNPNIVSVHSFCETDKGTFIVMECVETETLSEIIRDEGVFSVNETVSISKQLLSAISYAHGIGIIHRDIKTSNILLQKSGKVKITDFGLAKDTQAHGRDSTITQMKAGTLYYMSPEQVKGLKNVDKRSDIYSIGMTIYEMLAGRVPFDKTDSDFTIQKQIVDGKIPSPLIFNSDIPKLLAKIILKSVSADPNKRYQSAEEMLKAIVDCEKLNCTNEKIISINTKPIYKKPIFIFLSILVMVLATLLFTGILKELIEIVSELVSKPESARLSINTTPENAEVYLNDELIGITPIENHVLTSADINLFIKKSGFITVDTSLKIKKGKLSEFNFTLISNYVPEEIYGRLNVRSDPPGASIYLGGINIGKTPYYDNELLPGQYKISLRMEDYSQFTDTIEIRGNEDFEVAQILSHLRDNIKQGQVIESVPSGADITFDDRFKGTTPHKYNLEPGSYNLVISLKNYESYKETLYVEKGKLLKRHPKLVALANLKVTTQPEGAEILLDSINVGITPFNEKIGVGDYNLVLVKNGFESFDTSIILLKSNDIKINKVLNPLFGTISIFVIPFGSIYIDDKLQVKNSSKPFKLDSLFGEHNIKVKHRTFGTWEKTIDLSTKKEHDYNINFNKTFKLTISKPQINSESLSNCQIYVDGKKENKTAPKVLSLRTGIHTISVKKEGYELVGDDYIINIEADVDDPILFLMRKK